MFTVIEWKNISKNLFKVRSDYISIKKISGSLLLESKIQHDTAYQKQQETLIVWSEGENYDLALSFQEKAGCDEIWEKICQVRKYTKPFIYIYNFGLLKKCMHYTFTLQSKNSAIKYLYCILVVLEDVYTNLGATSILQFLMCNFTKF